MMAGFTSKVEGCQRAWAPPSVSGPGMRVLLLQGPVGPFFRRLQEFLTRNGFDCQRVSFNAGDRLFSDGAGRIGFSGSLDEWADWLSAYLAAGKADCIILFGAERPVHAVARRLGRAFGVPVLSLEEGYIRPGFVTAECGGNNASSPLAGRLPPADFEACEAKPGQDYRGFRAMCLYGAAYYTVRQFFSGPRERALFHRRMVWLAESLCWIRNYWRLVTRRAQNFRMIERLLEHYDCRYYLIPLQVSADSQLADAAGGWNNARLISEALRSFARAANPGFRLVFKIHPLERGHSGDHRIVHETAKSLGIAGRVDVLEAGSMGLLTRHSAGMITINSTSGLSAIHHGVPLMVLGKAIYRHPMLVTHSDPQPDFDSFWNEGRTADGELRHRFLAWLRCQSLKPGDFYAADGMAEACQSVLERLEQELPSGASVYDRETDMAAC